MKMNRRRHKQPSFLRSIWAPIVLASLLVIGMVGLRYVFQKRSVSDSPASPQASDPHIESSHINQIKSKLRELLATRSVGWTKERTQTQHSETWRVRVPGDLPIPSLHLAIKESLNTIGMRILQSESDPLSGRLFLRIGRRDSCMLCLRLIPRTDSSREQGKIALIIDDFGDRWDESMRSFFRLGADITISVIPGRRMSSRIAREAMQLGSEVILHLPMEPLDAPYKNDGYIILTQMSKQAVRKVIRRALDDVPSAIGMNNHMGSKVTSDRQVITDVLNEIKSRDMYFIDSRTTASTVAYNVARDLGIRCGRRDVFLDVENDEDAIRQSLWDLARKSKAQGFAIGIGHCRKRTLNVLREEIPKVQARGYQFVFLSEVVY